MVELVPLPPRDAIRALQAQGSRLEPSFAWQEIYGEEHAAMFTVAKSAGHDILQDIWSALVRALEDGETLASFSRRLKPLLVRKGWWGEAVDVDPLTGEEVLVRLGSLRRIRTIFDANMRVSYAAGHWGHFERLKSSRPYLRYVAVQDGLTRPEHQKLHNLVLRIDDPFWDVFAPPNGWNCRCSLQSQSERDIARLQATGEALRFEAPAVTMQAWTNKRTGEFREVPDGVDPGWDYNPGKAGHRETVRRLKAETGAVFRGVE